MSGKLLFLGASVLALTFCSACRTSGSADGKPESAAEQKKSTGKDLYLQSYKVQNPEDRLKLLKEAHSVLLQEVEQEKNLESALYLAYLYDLGHGVKPDGINAAKYYRIAADGGLKNAKIAIAEFWLRNGTLHDEAEKQIRSIPDYEKDPRCMLLLGTIQYAQNKRDDGFRSLSFAYANAGKNRAIRESVWNQINAAFLNFLKNDNFDGASEELTRKEALDGKNPSIPYYRGLIAMKKNQKKEARGYFDEAIRKDPANPFFYRERAILNAKEGRGEDALDDIKVAVAVSGNDPGFTRSRIEIYYIIKEMNGLIAYTTKLLKEDEKDIFALVSRAGAHMMNRSYEKAYQDYKTLSMLPTTKDIPDVQEGLAVASSHLGKLEDAEKAYEKILSQQESSPVTKINLAELYIVRGKFDAALKLLNSDALIRSEDKFIRCISNYLAASALLAEGKNADAPIKLYQELLPAFPKKTADLDWDTALFDTWLKQAKLPVGAVEKIAELTRLARETFSLQK